MIFELGVYCLIFFIMSRTIFACSLSVSVLLAVYFPTLAVITTISEFFVSAKSSVPKIEIFESSGIVFERSNDSPIAFFFVLFTRTISSSEFEEIRNPNAEPTLPLPIIDIS